jgi:hypothetical protein
MPPSGWTQPSIYETHKLTMYQYCRAWLSYWPITFMDSFLSWSLIGGHYRYLHQLLTNDIPWYNALSCHGLWLVAITGIPPSYWPMTYLDTMLSHVMVSDWWPLPVSPPSYWPITYLDTMLSPVMVSDWWPFCVTTSFPLGTAVTLNATISLPT